MTIKFSPKARQAILDHFKPQIYFASVIDKQGTEVTQRKGPVTCYAEPHGEDLIIRTEPLPITFDPIEGGEGPYRVAFFPDHDPKQWTFCEGVRDATIGSKIYFG